MKKSFMSILKLAAGSALVSLVLTGTAAAQGALTVYCSVQEEWCQLMVNEFSAIPE